jgi:hypothetical protein
MAGNLGFVPDRIVAGESIWISSANAVQSAQDITLTNYTPAGGYTLAYNFASPTPITVSAVANGANTGWTLEVTGAQSLLFRAGSLHYSALVTHTESGRKFAVDSGSIFVEASPLAVSQYAAALTAVETAIASYGTNNQRSLQLDGMSVSFGSLQELLDLRAFYKSEVARETSSRPSRIIRTRFT